MAKSKTVPSKTCQTKDYAADSVKSLSTNISSDRKRQSQDTARRSRRLQGMPALELNQEKPSDSTPSTPAFLSAGTVRHGTITSSGDDSTLAGAMDNNRILGKSHSDIVQSPQADPNITVNDVLEPDLEAVSEYNRTDDENSDGSEVEQDNNRNNQPNKPLRPKQDQHQSTSTKSSKKRKAVSSSAKKAAQSGLTKPAKKKQKVNKPIVKRQRKAGNSRPKTAKERFLAASAEDTRPLSWGEPEVWAETRPELCEALPWFRCWQGASHTHDGHVLGMLLDEDQGERAYMDEHVSITRAGGGMGKTTSGHFCQMADQDSEKGRIKAFINNEIDKVPMHLIIGKNNVRCPSKIPHRYCVGPDVHITDHWDEKSNNHVVVKFRFEKTDLDSKSWFAPRDAPDIEFSLTVKALRKECPTCKTIKPQVFASGWMCLNSKCSDFWSQDGAPASETQEYNPAFLKERTIFDGFLPTYAMNPELIQPHVNHGHTFPATRQCWQGIVCKLCGRCNLRRHWDAWRCRTEGCSFEHKLPMDVIAASSVMGDEWYGFQGHGVPQNKVLEPSLECEVKKHGLYRENAYRLGDGLIIAHINSNNTINSAPGGPDELFKRLQVDNLGLERLPMKQSVVEETYSRHFSHNFGMPYNYVVGHDNSTSLANAPKAIKEAVRRMTWAAKRIVPDKEFVNFNELLAIGYLESMKMNYHDDGEASLGPSVASLSLGCPAKMRWRLKAKYWCGFRDKAHKHYDPNQPVLPGCRKPEERHKLNELARTASTEELDKAAQVALAFEKNESKTPPVILELDLRHGDYMVMHGASMQVYYEHMVAPTDKLRFGLTCRFVKPEMVPQDMRTLGDFTPDPAKAYDGDLALYEDYMKIYNASRVTKRFPYPNAPRA